MDGDAIKDLGLKLLALADRLEQRGERLDGRLRQHAAELQGAAQAVSSGGQRFAREALDALRSQTREAVAASIADAAEASRRQLESAAVAAARSAREIDEATKALRKQRGWWLWAAPLALVVGAVIAAGGSSLLVWRNMAELKRADFGQDVLHATRSGALTRCGEALCARAGKQPRRYGENGEYVLVQD